MLYRLNAVDLLKTADRHLIEGYLVYSKGEHWWSKYLKPFGHVSLLIKKGDYHVWFEPATGFSEVVVFPSNTKWRDILEGRTWQRVRFWRSSKGYRCIHLFQPFTCVEQVKAFLGIRCWWIFTPNQLYRYINEQDIQAQKARG